MVPHNSQWMYNLSINLFLLCHLSRLNARSTFYDNRRLVMPYISTTAPLAIVVDDVCSHVGHGPDVNFSLRRKEVSRPQIREIVRI